MYVVIDGDDSGRKIAACFINNDEVQLRGLSEELECATQKMSSMLRDAGFEIVFCAADGIAAKSSELELDWKSLLAKVRESSSSMFTFSVGVGSSLHEAYVALLNAKSLGKDRISHFKDISK